MTYAHLTKYTRPPNFADFADFDRGEYYPIVGQNRDSDTLTRSNFRSTLRQLGGKSETVLVIRDSHFLVGWVESIYVHESDAAALAIADRIKGKLEDYPVVDEDDWSNLEYDEAYDYWHSMTLADRVDVCQRFRASIFAARRADDIPERVEISYLADGC